MNQTKTRHGSEPVQETARRKNTAAHAGSGMAAQAKFVEGINSSPYVAAQRQKFQSLFGGAAQLEADPAQRVEEEEPLQGKFDLVQRVEEEEPLQGKFEPVQRVEDEEPLQGKFEPLQRVEEEEPLQGKFEAVQRVEEEEPLQGKFEPVQRVEEEEPLQGKFEPLQRAGQEEPLQGKFASQAVQLEEQPAPRPNNTGLPDNLKAGIESLSGLSMDAVRVHYNSSQPAQLNALAYAQGTDIHVAPGQEKHLPHEAWHVVQQAQGRVQPTTQMKEGVPVNDDKSLENEADAMGAKAAQLRAGRIEMAADSPRPGRTELPVQRFMACYSRSDLGYDDDRAGNWYFETIGSCRYQRVGGIAYTLTDGSNTGSIKHYVPSNWISKNLIDNHIIGFQRHAVITRLTAIQQGLGLGVPGHDTGRRDGFDAWVSDSVDAICDWEQNLFRDVPSSGDHGGTTVDTPTDGAVLLRVQAARQQLRGWGIGHQAL